MNVPRSTPHVAVLGTVAHLGGAERSLLELLRALARELRFTLILPEEGPLVPCAAAAGARVRVLRWPDALQALGERARRPDPVRLLRAGASVPLLVHGLRRLLREIQPDLLVTNGIKAHVIGAAAARRGELPLVWYCRESVTGRRLSARLLRLLGGRVSGAIAISRFVGDELADLLPNNVPVSVIYNIVDTTTFRQGLPLPADLEKRAGEIWFGVVGALTPLKGQDLFLEAAERVARVLPGARFLLVGSNLYKTEATLEFPECLRRQAEQLGLADRVRFLGEREDVASIVANLDVLVQPNRGPEGLGRAVLEAMACAVPVIAVNRFGPVELVCDGKTGFLTEWMDVASLAEKMIRLGSERGLRARLGQGGRQRVLDEFAGARAAAAFRIFVDEVLRRAATAIPPRRSSVA